MTTKDIFVVRNSFYSLEINPFVFDFWFFFVSLCFGLFVCFTEIFVTCSPAHSGTYYVANADLELLILLFHHRHTTVCPVRYHIRCVQWMFPPFSLCWVHFSYTEAFKTSVVSLALFPGFLDICFVSQPWNSGYVKACDTFPRTFLLGVLHCQLLCLGSESILSWLQYIIWNKGSVSLIWQ